VRQLDERRNGDTSCAIRVERPAFRLGETQRAQARFVVHHQEEVGFGEGAGGTFLLIRPSAFSAAH
jgi:hypothetical protein